MFCADITIPGLFTPQHQQTLFSLIVVCKRARVFITGFILFFFSFYFKCVCMYFIFYFSIRCFIWLLLPLHCIIHVAYRLSWRAFPFIPQRNNGTMLQCGRACARAHATLFLNNKYNVVFAFYCHYYYKSESIYLEKYNMRSFERFAILFQCGWFCVFVSIIVDAIEIDYLLIALPSAIFLSLAHYLLE